MGPNHSTLFEAMVYVRQLKRIAGALCPGVKLALAQRLRNGVAFEEHSVPVIQGSCQTLKHSNLTVLRMYFGNTVAPCSGISSQKATKECLWSKTDGGPAICLGYLSWHPFLNFETSSLSSRPSSSPPRLAARCCSSAASALLGLFAVQVLANLYSSTQPAFTH